MHISSRRIAALVAGSALSLTLLPAAPASAFPNGPDPTGSVSGSAWLTSQLTAGLIHNNQFDFDDVGLSIDTALALQALHDQGGQATTSTVSTISAAVATNIAGYVGDGTIESYAGPLGKAATLAQVTGGDPTSFGGVNLISRLEARVLTGGATDGRVQDASAFGDFANTIGQAFASEALTGATSPKATSVQGFLLQQQCPDGWFRLSFAAVAAPAQGCVAGTDTPDTDTTAFAVLAFEAHTPLSGPATTAVNKAVAWLQSTQKSDGSWGGSGPTAASNANSTGLAGWALGVAATPSLSAGTWLREHQLTDVGACQPFHAADAGAVAYDDTALAGASAGITTTKQDQFRRATAQALPALLWSMPNTGGPTVPGPSKAFFRAGSTFDTTLLAGTPSGTYCFTVPGAAPVLVRANRNGTAPVHLVLPATTGDQTVSVQAQGGAATSVFHVYTLAAERLAVDVGKKQVHRGDKESVKVTDLAPGETVKVFLGKKKVAHGEANGRGVFKGSFGVTGKLGKGQIKVTGQYDDLRKGATKIRVLP